MIPFDPHIGTGLTRIPILHSTPRMITIKVGADRQLNGIIYDSVRGTISGVIMGDQTGS